MTLMEAGELVMERPAVAAPKSNDHKHSDGNALYVHSETRAQTVGQAQWFICEHRAAVVEGVQVCKFHRRSQEES